MKRCPTCNRTFPEDHLSFCVEDGTPLVTAVDDEATVVRSGSADSSTGPSGSAAADRALYQPPGSYVPPGYNGERKRRTWPWLLGVVIVLVVIAGMGIAAVLLVRNVGRKYDDIERRNSAPANTNERDANANSNSNFNSSNRNDNSNHNLSADDSTPPPTDEIQVLSDLTDLEHEWTVANINADKKKLDQILADDYVGMTEGKSQGKAEYLKTINRDTSIQKWNFEELKVNLKSDRATLTGTIRLDVKDDQGEVRPVAFLFTDKFVWRDGRWQATGSEVKPLQE
ncbi:MAG TPA: nuclear transport factor 2 family protein [Pyrinomonadaceae bacterium]|nr:nuclear transport factor 2 family protein [Pyrinomonadaceae bacterium]